MFVFLNFFHAFFLFWVFEEKKKKKKFTTRVERKNKEFKKLCSSQPDDGTASSQAKWLQCCLL